jgi:glycosyltransferase involved in cell wall biosynthesis
MSHFGGSPERYAVIPCAASSLFRPVPDAERVRTVLSHYRIEQSAHLLLYVGGLSPHKNLPRLIEAFAGVRGRACLAIVGDTGDCFHTHVPEIRAAAKRAGQRVVLTGYVPDHDLVCLYGAARALVQPSLIEGFGLPPVEAMACGTPVVASRAGSLPEVVGDAGILFDASSVAAIRGALDLILSDDELHATLARRALERAPRFSWRVAASAVATLLEDAAAGGTRRSVA